MGVFNIGLKTLVVREKNKRKEKMTWLPEGVRHHKLPSRKWTGGKHDSSRM
jgi:hypothetical protein